MTSLSPSQGNAKGGFSSFVIGTGFRPEQQYFCLFGVKRVDARYRDHHTLECIAPRLSPGLVSFDVGEYGIDDVISKNNFVFFEAFEKLQLFRLGLFRLLRLPLWLHRLFLRLRS